MRLSTLDPVYPDVERIVLVEQDLGERDAPRLVPMYEARYDHEGGRWLLWDWWHGVRPDLPQIDLDCDLLDYAVELADELIDAVPGTVMYHNGTLPVEVEVPTNWEG